MYKTTRLSPTRLRVLIAVWRLQDFKGWKMISIHDIAQAMPYSIARSYTPSRAVKDLEVLYEIGLVKRHKATDPKAFKRGNSLRVTHDYDYSTTVKGNELIDMLREEGLKRWIDR